MSYYFTKTINTSMDEALEKVTEALKVEGFGILSEIDVKATFKMKLDVDFRPYKILGACNPPFAKRVLEIDDKIGVMLPCNIILQQRENGVEITSIDPTVAMNLVNNPEITDIANEIKEKLKNVIDSL